VKTVFDQTHLVHRFSKVGGTSLAGKQVYGYIEYSVVEPMDSINVLLHRIHRVASRRAAPQSTARHCL